MRVMVFGATGFIGGQIARAAHDASMTVHALRRDPVSTGAMGDLPITWHTGDLDDPESLQKALNGCEVLFHAAGYAPATQRSVRRALLMGTRQMRYVLDAARAANVQRVIYTSSLTTIGPAPEPDRLADERDLYQPGSTWNSYYEVKWVMELQAVRAAHYGLPVVILCPTAVFGPEDVKPSTSQVLLELARGRIPIGIDAPMNIVDGRDVALAHVRAVESGTAGERYIIGGHNVNLAQALRQAARIAGVREPHPDLSHQAATRLLAVADFFRLPITATMRGLPYWQHYNTQKGQRTFDITPRPFEVTVQDTVTWFRENGYL